MSQPISAGISHAALPSTITPCLTGLTANDTVLVINDIVPVKMKHSAGNEQHSAGYKQHSTFQPTATVLQLHGWIKYSSNTALKGSRTIFAKQMLAHRKYTL